MAEIELPPGPYDAPVVDAGRKITVPWKGWIGDWLARLQAAVNGALAGAGSVTTIGELTSSSSAATVPLMGQARVDLAPVARSGGHFIVDGSFTASQVGAPVIAQLFPVRVDEAEGIIIAARAVVVSSRAMRVHWMASSPISGPAVLYFAIGALEP